MEDPLWTQTNPWTSKWLESQNFFDQFPFKEFEDDEKCTQLMISHLNVKNDYQINITQYLQKPTLCPKSTIINQPPRLDAQIFNCSIT